VLGDTKHWLEIFDSLTPNIGNCLLCELVSKCVATLISCGSFIIKNCGLGSSSKDIRKWFTQQDERICNVPQPVLDIPLWQLFIGKNIEQFRGLCGIEGGFIGHPV